MAVSASIKFTQGATTAPAGRALLGTLGGGAVVVTNGDNTDVNTWTFEWVDLPAGSAVGSVGVIQQGQLPSFTFTPDLVGGYLVDLIVTDRSGNTATDRRCFQVPETTGRIIPPFGAGPGALNFSGQTRGWSPYQTAYNKFVDTLAGGGGGTGTINQIEIPLVGAPVSTVVGSSATFRAGQRKIDMTPYPSPTGGKTLTAKFVCDFETTAGTATATLFNVTDGESVTSASFTTTSTSNTESTATVVVGSSAGNLKSNKSYQVRLSLAGGGGTDFATLTHARIVISYA